MAATIIERTISGVPEKAIQLNNAQFGRPITLPVGWAKVRIGLRYHLTDSGGTITPAPTFVVGLGAGTTNMVGDATTTHWVGTYPGPASYVRAATYYSAAANCIWAVTKTNGAAFNFGSGQVLTNGIIYHPNGAAAATADRKLWFTDITKGSPNFTINAFYSSTTVMTDISSATFLSQMVNDTPALAEHALATQKSIAVDEGTYGTLDTVQIWWSHADPILEINDLAVAVLA